MELLNNDSHLRNPELRHQLVGKLPSALQLQWDKRAHGSAELDLRDFATWLAGRGDAASFVIMQAQSSAKTAQQRGVAPPQEGESTSKQSEK